MTLTAFPGRVSRIYRDQYYTRESCLIFQKSSQLREGPTIQNGTLPAPNPYPFANAAQFFDGESTAGAFGYGGSTERKTGLVQPAIGS